MRRRRATGLDPGRRGARPAWFRHLPAWSLAALATFAGAAWAADPAKGATTYSNHCAACHGRSGRPVWPGAPDLSRPGSLLRTDAQLIALLKQGRGVMPSYLGVIRERDMLDLIAYVRTLN